MDRSRPRQSPDGPIVLTGGAGEGRLAAWLADARVDEAARDRARQRWLQRQADEEASLAGVFVDLGERAERVVLTTSGSSRLAGRVTAVGPDFVVLADGAGGDVMVPVGAIEMVRSTAEVVATGDRALTIDTPLATVLADLSAELPTVRVVTANDEVRGVLRSCGVDVVIVQPSAGTGAVHLPVGAVDHVVVVAR